MKANEDSVRNLVRALFPGRQLAIISKRIGKNHAYLQQFLRRGSPRVLPEDVRRALARESNRRPDDFLPPSDVGERAAHQLGIDPALHRRAEAVAYRLIGSAGDAETDRIKVEVASAVYTLLENEWNGIPISDNEITLRVIEFLIRRVKREPRDP